MGEITLVRHGQANSAATTANTGGAASAVGSRLDAAPRPALL